MPDQVNELQNPGENPTARTEIAELKAQYARRADAVFNQPGHASAVALADLFTQDGVIDLGPFGRYEGRPALINAFENILPQATKWSTHYIVSPILSIAGDDATGDWYFLIKSVPQAPPNAPVFEIMGGYADKYHRTPGGWKIRESISRFFVPPS